MRVLPLRSALLFGIALLTATAAGAAPSDDAEMTKLAKARNCMACHQVSSKVIGPGYQEIARKYAKTPGAEEMLTKKIREGGSGAWSDVPMPANLQATEEESRLLARWILAK